jgi:hypothetical protein
MPVRLLIRWSLVQVQYGLPVFQRAPTIAITDTFVRVTARRPPLSLIRCRHSFRQIHQTVGLMNDVAHVRNRRAQNVAGVRNHIT